MKHMLQIGVFIWSVFVVGSCPTSISIVQCTCNQTSNEISVRCKGPELAERITSVIKNIKSSGNLKVILESLNLPVLPTSVISEVFALYLQNVHIDKVSNTSSYSWSKLNSVIFDSSTILKKSWPYFKGAKQLKSLKIRKLNIPRIGSEFRQSVPATVGFLDIRKTSTYTLEKNAMSHLKNLWYLSMIDIPLRELPRDALPLEMPKLYSLTIVNTKIENLNPGFFNGMPKLEVLWLHGNRLFTLNSELFTPVKNHLKYLMAEANPLICDCNLAWLTTMNKEGSMKVLVSCTDDDTQEIKQISTLNEKELCFYQ